MRVINAFFCITLLVFTVVQHNDTHYYFWMPVYGVPAILAAIATWSPASLRHRAMQVGVAVCAVLGVIGTVLLWLKKISSGARLCGGKARSRARAWA